MRSFLTITTEADDLALLSITEMRAAAGVTGTGSDAVLRAMEAQNAAAIMSECNIAAGAGFPPTLLKERLTETFYVACGVQALILSRRHDVAIVSIVEDGVTLVEADWIVEPESGILTKLCNDYPSWWSGRKIVVVYDAGFETVPGDLKKVATEFFRSMWLEQSRDPMVKSERVKVEGVDETQQDFWVGSIPGQSSQGAVPDIIAGSLKRFRNVSLG